MGIGHVHPLFSTTESELVLEYMKKLNSEMLNRSRNRLEVYKRWKIGAEFRNIFSECIEILPLTEELNSNKIEIIPEWLGWLEKLLRVDLRGNFVHKIPSSIKNYFQRKYILSPRPYIMLTESFENQNLLNLPVDHIDEKGKHIRKFKSYKIT